MRDFPLSIIFPFLLFLFSYNLIGAIIIIRNSVTNSSPCFTRRSGDVAQMVERSLSMREALGSTPSFSTQPIFFRLSYHYPFWCCHIVTKAELKQTNFVTLTNFMRHTNFMTSTKFMPLMKFNQTKLKNFFSINIVTMKTMVSPPTFKVSH